MSPRFVVIGSATVLAVIILMLTIVGGYDPPPKPTQAMPLQPIEVPDIPAAQRRPGIQAIQGTYELRRKLSSGNVEELLAKKYEPLPDGAVELKDARGRIYTTDPQVIEIRFGRGQVVAPDNKPQSGIFEEDVQLRLFEGSGGEPLNLEPGSRHQKAVCYFDGWAAFDLDMGTWQSDSMVHLSSPRCEVVGRGMQFTYSEMDRRLKKLVGFENGELRYSPAPAAPEPTTRTRRSTKTASDTNPGASATTVRVPPTTIKAPIEPPQYYLVTFPADVVIHHNTAQIRAVQLHIVATLKSEQKDGGLLESFGKSDPDETHMITGTQVGLALGNLHRSALLQMVAAVLTNTGHPSTSLAAVSIPRQSMTPITDRDTIVRWRGNLTIEPLGPDAPELAELQSPDDVYVMLTGNPVRVTTHDDQTIRAAKMDYLTGSGRVRLTGAEHHPQVEINSPEIGAQIIGRQLVIDQQAATGIMLGPGLLRSHDEPGMIEAIEPGRQLGRRQSRMPPGLVVRWDDALDMTFFQDASTTARDTVREPMDLRISALRQAVFHGAVDVEDPSFRLKSERLALNLDKPVEGHQVLRQILAEQNVQVVAEVDGQDQPLSIESDWLTLDLQRLANGGMRPTRLLAKRLRNQVILKHDIDLFTDHLDVSFDVRESSAREAAGTQPPVIASSTPRPALHAAVVDIDAPGMAPALESPHDEPRREPVPSYQFGANDPQSDDSRESKVNVAVRVVIADGNTRIEIPNEQTLIRADRVVANAPSEWLELYGRPSRPARLDRPDGTLMGQYIKMYRAGQMASVVGPGQALFHDEARQILPAATAPPPPVEMAPLNIRWQQSMDFNNESGVAQFVGNVIAFSTFDNDTARLKANDLRVEFIDTTSPSTDPNSDDAERPAEGLTLERLVGGNRTVKFLKARENVTFLAESWVDELGDELASTVQIQGSNLTFNGLTEQIKVKEEGSMVFVDLRAPPTDDTHDDPKPAGQLPSFRGTGQTLFEWTGSMTLDAHRNEMHLRRDVQMVHQPQGETDVMQLDAQFLTADLEETGGLKVWLGEHAPKPQVKVIKADEKVRVYQGDTRVETDHLTYYGPEEMVHLEADDGWVTQVYSADGTAKYSSKIMRWYPKTGRFQLEQAGHSTLGE